MNQSKFKSILSNIALSIPLDENSIIYDCNKICNSIILDTPNFYEGNQEILNEMQNCKTIYEDWIELNKGLNLQRKELALKVITKMNESINIINGKMYNKRKYYNLDDMEESTCNQKSRIFEINDSKMDIDESFYKRLKIN